MKYTSRLLKFSGKVFKARTKTVPTPWEEALNRTLKTQAIGVHSRQNEKTWTRRDDVEEKVAVLHRGRCNNKVYYRLSHDVVT